MVYNRQVGSVHDFGKKEQFIPKRSTLIRTHTIKTTFDEGQLIPIYCQPVFPKDTIKLQISGLIRLATPIKPIFDNITVEYHAFYGRNRTLLKCWRKVAGERLSMAEATAANDNVLPFITTTEGFAELSLFDYFGIPTKVAVEVNIMPLLLYNTVWQDYVRAPYLTTGEINLYQDLDTDINYDEKDEDGNYIYHKDFVVRNVMKKKDYFTTAMPYTQVGIPVGLSLAGNAPIHQNNTIGVDPSFVRINAMVHSEDGLNWEYGKTTKGTIENSSNSSGYTDVKTNNLQFPELNPPTSQNGFLGIQDAFAVLSDASSVYVNTIRYAFKDQQYQELIAQGGTRYFEIIQSTWNSYIPDSMLDRPDYIGCFKEMVVVTPIAQQTQTLSDTTPQGNLSAVGFSTTNKKRRLSHYCEDSGYVLVVMCTKANLSYQAGLNKMWSTRSILDFYQPIFSNIGEQPIYNREINCTGDATLDGDVFGYQEAWSEHKFGTRLITGLFRSNASQSLDFWHLADDYGENTPVLNETWLTEQADLDRCIAVPSEPHFIAEFEIDEVAHRQMPVYNVPTGLGR